MSNQREILGNYISVSSGEGLAESRMKPGSFLVYGGNGVSGTHDTFLFEHPQLIIGRVGAHCGNVYITKEKSWITDNALIVTFKDRQNEKYFWLYLLQHLKLREKAFQNAQPVITGGIINRIRVSIPSFPEQQRIAKILSTADAVIEKTQAAIAKYEAIKQGMLHDLFTRGIDLSTNKLRPRYKDVPELYKEGRLGWVPKEWSEKRLGELCTMKSGDGITSEKIFEMGDYPVYGGNGLRGFTSKFTHNGDFTLIGRQGALCGNITRVSGKFYASEHAVVVTPENDVELDWLSQKLYDMNLNQYSEATAQPGLSVFKIIPLLVTAPPFKEQKRIADKLKGIDNKILIEEGYLKKMHYLKKGLMEDLLSGKKAVTVPEELKEFA